MLRVLIADDEFDARDNMIQLVDWAGHGMKVIDAVDNGVSAYEAITNQLPDIVLIDIRMRGMNGLEVIEKVRNDKCWQPVFIVISGYDDFVFVQKGISLKIDGYLLKPFRPDDVIEIIENHFQDMNASRELNHGLPDFGHFLAELGRSLSPLHYPAIEEDDLVSAIMKGTADDVRNAVSAFHNALAAQNLSDVSLFNSYIILYAEISRHLRSCSLSGAADTGIWDNEAPLRSMQKLLGIIALRAQQQHIESMAKGNSPFLRAKAFIDEFYAEPLTLETVAQAVYVSPNYLSGCFAKHVGIGFLDYIKNVRIAHARILLSDPNMTVDQVASATGYNDTKYFRQVFKQITGVSPSSFLKAIY